MKRFCLCKKNQKVSSFIPTTSHLQKHVVAKWSLSFCGSGIITILQTQRGKSGGVEKALYPEQKIKGLKEQVVTKKEIFFRRLNSLEVTDVFSLLLCPPSFTKRTHCCINTTSSTDTQSLRGLRWYPGADSNSWFKRSPGIQLLVEMKLVMVSHSPSLLSLPLPLGK